MTGARSLVAMMTEAEIEEDEDVGGHRHATRCLRV